MSDSANNVRPDYAASIAFLRRFHPGRLWALTAIHPDKNFKPRTVTATYDEKHEAECVKWLEDKGATYNLYVSVAEPLRSVDKKCERTDIARVWYLHVDVDPRTGEPIPAEQARIKALLEGAGRAEVIPGKIPAPPILTYSGGGYQGFWPLETPIEIGGDLAFAEDAKLFNLKIELELGADNCHNIDRVMRLAGTVNRPDAGKIAKGRTEALATVVHYRDEKFSLDRFSKAPPLTVESDDTGLETPATGNVKLSGNVKRLEQSELDALPVADWIKALINVGYDPKNPNPLLPKRYPSRSEALFAVVCGLVKAKVDDDTIYGILTDDRLGISASVLELGSRAQRYATRQIARAKEETTHPWLASLNDRHAVIRNWCGQCRVIEEQFDESTARYRLTKQGFEDFANGYGNIKVDLGQNDEGKLISKPLGTWWLNHAHRRQYEKIVFAPGKDIPGAYNLYRGFAFEPKPGDCGLYLTHLRDVVCSGNDRYFNYLVGWMANGVQNPHRPGETAVVLKGDQGTGKGFAIKPYGRLFGRHFKQVTNPKHLVGNFNAHLHDCIVLFADEAFYAGDKKHESILKTLITEYTLTVERKGVDAEESANCVHLLMASNNSWVVPAGVGDRRFFVLEVPSARKDDHAYFGRLQAQLDNGGYEALLHNLLNLDLSSFNVRDFPKTNASTDQQILTLRGGERLLFELHASGKLPSGDKTPLDKRNNKDGMKPLELVRVPYTELLRWFNFQLHERHEPQLMGTDLMALIGEWLGAKARESNGSKTFFPFACLQTSRALIERKLGRTVDWQKYAHEFVDERSNEQRERDEQQKSTGPEDSTGWEVEVPSYPF